MKKIQILFGILLVFFLFQNNSIAAVVKNAANTDQKIILAEINAYRVKRGLLPLKMNHLISGEAKNHSYNMATGIIPFSHDGFNKRAQRLYQQFKQTRAIAENVAYNNRDAETVVKQWLTSAGHRKNIEGNFNLTGIGIARNKNGLVYVTQIFLLK